MTLEATLDVEAQTHRVYIKMNPLLLAVALLLTTCTPEPTPTTEPTTDTQRQGDDAAIRDAQDTVPPPSRYPEVHRPQLHFSTERNWLNDPNGLVFLEGLWHLYYQHNPFLPIWGPMYWGHATSTDLIHWQHHPIALEPDDTLGLAFSGSAVIDANNTSGLCPPDPTPCLIAFFTHHASDNTEVQSLAVSTDSGLTLTPYAGNPVLNAPPNTPDFRDPRVFWHPDTERWLMVLAAGDHAEIYSAPDLLTWTLESRFDADVPEGVWECPELFQLDVAGEPGTSRWVFEIDLSPGVGAPGTVPLYWTGTFEGTAFVPDNAAGQRVDWGDDFYASQAWSHVPDGRTLWIAWMSNWAYALSTPTAPWRGAMTLPRSLGLRRSSTSGALELTQEPVSELEDLRDTTLLELDTQPLPEGESALLDGLSASQYELVMTVAPGTANRLRLGLRVGDGERTDVIADFAAGTLSMDRTLSGAVNFNEHFPALHSAPLELTNSGHLELRIIVDTSSIELFAQGGATVFTNRVFPAPESQALTLSVEGGVATLERLKLTALRSIWVP